MTDLAREIVAQADRMQSDKSTYSASCQEIRDFIVPLATALTSTETPGQKTHGNVLDNTGETAHEMLASALVSILTPDEVDWFTLRVSNERINQDPAAAIWLEDTTRVMLAAFRKPESGFAVAQHEKYIDVSSFGTCGGFIADRPGRGVIFSSVPLKQLLIDEDADGFVDTVYRDFTLSARQAVQRWNNKCGGKILSAAGDPKKQDSRFRIIHAVRPRHSRDSSKNDRRNKRFSSTYVAVDDKHEIDDGGFDDMPYTTPRWMKRGEEVWGRGCGFKALADVKSLQRGTKIQFEGAELVMRPPMMVADDGVTSPVRQRPGGITYYRAGIWNTDPIKALNTGARPDLGEELLAGIRQRIENAFLKPLIQMIRKDRMTATEVLQVMEEGQRILGPFLGRLKTEDLGPMITRVFGIMLRAGAFRPLPGALQGQQIEIEYVSPAVKSQRVARARGLAQLSEITAPLVQMDQTLLDNLDGDKAFRDTADVLGVPMDWLRDPKKVTEIRAARQKVQEQQAQHQAELQTVDTAANAVRALPALKQAMGDENAAA